MELNFHSFLISCTINLKASHVHNFFLKKTTNQYKKRQYDFELEHFLQTSLLRGRFFAGANFHNSNELQLLTPARLVTSITSII